MLRTAEHIMGDESAGKVQLPHKATLRMLLFKYQVGAVMGKRGAAINEIRNKSGASVKLTTPHGGVPIVPSAEMDDELITVSAVLCVLMLLLRGCEGGCGVEHGDCEAGGAVVVQVHLQACAACAGS